MVHRKEIIVYSLPFLFVLVPPSIYTSLLNSFFVAYLASSMFLECIILDAIFPDFVSQKFQLRLIIRIISLLFLVFLILPCRLHMVFLAFNGRAPSLLLQEYKQ